jgi:polar amino acid transport system substrate-binding protein
MSDDRLRRWLEAAEQPLKPDPEFAAALRDELRHELGFARVERVHPMTRTVVGRHLGRRARRPWDILLVAALIVAGSIGLVAVAGAIVERTAVLKPPSLLAEIREAGQMRIAIRPDHPQAAIGGQPAAGFDVDVGSEIARRLGVTPATVIEDASRIVAPSAPGAWDIALPSLPLWTVDRMFLSTSPYYLWPHRLVVRSISTASTPADVAAGPICAVAGDAGESWLRGSYGGVTSTPITTALVTRASDEECLSALASGSAVAFITAHLSDADLQVRDFIRIIGGPAPEPRPVIVRRQSGSDSDPSDLIRAIDDALDEMRTDGTLTRLSENRFGGADLTTP